MTSPPLWYKSCSASHAQIDIVTWTRIVLIKPKFDEWQDGRNAARYEQAEKTDMTRVPNPRFDLLEVDRYAFGSLQFSRGCPLQSEFCDITVNFGSRPRLKTSAQAIAELDAIRRTGRRIVFIVDDNFIGNKKAIFESDDTGVFDRQIDFIQQARIPFAMTGLLHAIPNTPLYERVLAEGRLDLVDRLEFVTNIRPLQMSPEELRDGYLRVMAHLFDPLFLRSKSRRRLTASDPDKKGLE